MSYPTRERKKPDKFQAFEAGDKHAPVSQRVEMARQRRKDRDRKKSKAMEVDEKQPEVPTDNEKAVEKNNTVESTKKVSIDQKEKAKQFGKKP